MLKLSRYRDANVNCFPILLLNEKKKTILLNKVMLWLPLMSIVSRSLYFMGNLNSFTESTIKCTVNHKSSENITVHT